jgi:hypothetical protein
MMRTTLIRAAVLVFAVLVGAAANAQPITNAIPGSNARR